MVKLENHGLSVGKELLTVTLLSLEQCLCLGWKDKLKSLLFGDHVFLPEVELSIRWGQWREREKWRKINFQPERKTNLIFRNVDAAVLEWLARISV